MKRLRYQSVEVRGHPDGLYPEVRERAKQKGLSLDQLARRQGLDVQDVRDVAAGRVTRVAITFFPTLRAIAEGLDVAFDILYPADWISWAESRLFGDDVSPLKLARLRAGLTIGELAEKADTRGWHISRLEHGELPWQRQSLALPHQRRIAAVFGSHYTRMFGRLLDNPQPTRARSWVPRRPAKVKLPEGWPDLWNWRAERRLTRRGVAMAARVTITNLRQLELGHPIPIKSITLRLYAERLGKLLDKPKTAIATPVVVQSCAAARTLFVRQRQERKARG